MLLTENMKKETKIEEMADFHGKKRAGAVLSSLQGSVTSVRTGALAMALQNKGRGKGGLRDSIMM